MCLPPGVRDCISDPGHPARTDVVEPEDEPDKQEPARERPRSSVVVPPPAVPLSVSLDNLKRTPWLMIHGGESGPLVNPLLFLNTPPSAVWAPPSLSGPMIQSVEKDTYIVAATPIPSSLLPRFHAFGQSDSPSPPPYASDNQHHHGDSSLDVIIFPARVARGSESRVSGAPLEFVVCVARISWGLGRA